MRIAMAEWNKEKFSAILILLGFRAVFGFMNIPIGLELQPKLHLDTLKALANPTFLALYPKSVLASYTLTFIILARVFRDELGKRFAKLGLGFLITTAILGIIYEETLRTLVEYKFENVMSSSLTAVKLILIAIQFVALLLYLLKDVRSALIPAGACALAGILVGETLNALSQYP